MKHLVMTLKQQVSDINLGMKNYLVILKKNLKSNYSVLHLFSHVILHNFCDGAFLVKEM